MAIRRKVTMTKPTKRSFPVGLLVICSLLLSACGGENPTATTAPAAEATATTAPGGEATPTTEAMAGETPTTGAPTGAFKFDPAAYKKNTVEPGARLRVSSWGDTSEQGVNRDALARFNQVYPDVKITYEPQPSDYTTKLLAQVKGG